MYVFLARLKEKPEQRATALESCQTKTDIEGWLKLAVISSGLNSRTLAESDNAAYRAIFSEPYFWTRAKQRMAKH